MEIKDIETKSILIKSKLPDADYVVNPYTGCRFGCIYCYASFMSRYVGKDISDWGEFVYVKVNAPELLKTEIRKLKNNGAGLCILFSSVTDPYQGLEAKYEITKKCLKVIADSDFLGKISILTKSPMVTRDIDLLKKIKHVEVGMTITSTEDQVSRYFEKNAPNVTQRFDALKELNGAQIETYAFVGPLLPTYIKNADALDRIFREIKDSGTIDVYVEHLNLSKYIYDRLKQSLPDLVPRELEMFNKTKSKSYRDELNEIVRSLVSKYGLRLRLNEAIYHKDAK